jgi:hypothetical protein
MHMSVSRPYHQTARQFADGDYMKGGRWMYIRHPHFARDPTHYIRGFDLIQKDLLTLFEYIEPAEQNHQAHSFRTFELLLRICTELEANFKSILRANTYNRSSARDLNIRDYHLIERSHFLSQFEVQLPHWTGEGDTRRPFATWADSHRLAWYDAYNSAKHDRASNLHDATLEHVIDAFCGLAVVLAAQFLDQSFSPLNDYLAVEGPGDGSEDAIGGYLRLKWPTDVPEADRYEFNWQDLKSEDDPFQRFDYDALARQRQ